MWKWSGLHGSCFCFCFCLCSGSGFCLFLVFLPDVVGKLEGLFEVRVALLVVGVVAFFELVEVLVCIAAHVAGLDDGDGCVRAVVRNTGTERDVVVEDDTGITAAVAVAKTVDVTGVRETSFFEVTTQTNKYQVRDVTADYLPYLNDVLVGDANADGVVNIVDVTVLIDVLLNDNVSGYDPDAADVNGDGRITITDVTELIDQLLS